MVFNYKIKSLLGYQVILTNPQLRIATLTVTRVVFYGVKICLYASGEKCFGKFVEITQSPGF